MGSSALKDLQISVVFLPGEEGTLLQEPELLCYTAPSSLPPPHIGSYIHMGRMFKAMYPYLCQVPYLFKPYPYRVRGGQAHHGYRLLWLSWEKCEPQPPFWCPLCVQ